MSHVGSEWVWQTLILVENEGIWEEPTLEEEWKAERGEGPGLSLRGEGDGGKWIVSKEVEGKGGKGNMRVEQRAARANWLVWGANPCRALFFYVGQPVTDSVHSGSMESQIPVPQCGVDFVGGLIYVRDLWHPFRALPQSRSPWASVSACFKIRWHTKTVSVFTAVLCLYNETVSSVPQLARDALNDFLVMVFFRCIGFHSYCLFQSLAWWVSLEKMKQVITCHK